MRYFYLLILTFLLIKSQAQNAYPDYTKAAERMANLDKRKTLESNSLLNNVQFTNIGPSIMSGRVVDVDVNPQNATEFYVAYASGGLWYTNNNGQSFTPCFDHLESITIGDIAVNWTTGTIWVGTGENNSSRSSYAGTGVYKSMDKGKTWSHLGLAETHHIGKIILNKKNDQQALVGAVGHLYTYNSERGVFKTLDGGATWKKTLYVDDTTGCIDLQIDPLHENVVYAAMWHRDRKPWNFVESGNSSGIYKSEDGGDTWKLITTQASGFPHGDNVGRIGIAIYPKNTNLLYAVLDNQAHQPEKKKTEKELTSKQLRSMSSNEFLNTDSALVKKFLRNHEMETAYPYSKIRAGIISGKYHPVDLANFVSDANSDLFDTPVAGGEVYKSSDGGQSWTKQNKYYLDGMYNTYGYYFGKIYVSPTRDSDVYIMGVPLLKSTDAGQTFKAIEGDNQHGDHHVLWIDALNPKHIINGNDGGINITYDDGAHWIKCNTPSVGQFYAVAVDDAKPYNVYGGLQDNGVWVGSSSNNENTNWYEEGVYGFKRLYGGDGMQVQVDTRDNNTVYTGYQFGNYARLNKATGRQETGIHPMPELGEEPLRYSWQTPIWLSKHSQDIFYMGSNKFHRSLTKAEDMKTLSADLTNGKKEGDVPYGTISTLCESPKKFGLIYLGTDDGNVWVSTDVGYNWKNISAGLPKNLRVMRVTPSAFAEGRIYVAMSGFQFDNFAPYLFVSENYGNTWQQIGRQLPDEPINVIKEDPNHDKILFVGTDNGLYASLDQGANFMSMNGGLPRVAIHDIAIQKREHEIILGTHGRSIYKASLTDLETLADSIGKTFITSASDIMFNKNWGHKWQPWSEAWQPNQIINYLSDAAGVYQFSLENADGKVLYEKIDSAEAGINNFTYHLQIDNKFPNSMSKQPKNKTKGTSLFQAAENGEYYLPTGTYKWVMKHNGQLLSEKKWEVKKDKKDIDAALPLPETEKE